MFSGFIQTTGKILTREDKEVDCRFTIETNAEFVEQLVDGASVAVSGVCLTSIASAETTFTVDVSNETLQCTTFEQLKIGAGVNLERALRIGDELGGHFVSGHVDGTGEVVSRAKLGQCEQFIIDAPRKIAPLIAPKGSICVNGVSLTVNAVNNTKFEVNIIPYTLQETHFSAVKEGDQVNLEVDLIARYLARLLQLTQEK